MHVVQTMSDQVVCRRSLWPSSTPTGQSSKDRRQTRSFQIVRNQSAGLMEAKLTLVYWITLLRRRFIHQKFTKWDGTMCIRSILRFELFLFLSFFLSLVFFSLSLEQAPQKTQATPPFEKEIRRLKMFSQASLFFNGDCLRKNVLPNNLIPNFRLPQISAPSYLSPFNFCSLSN